MPDRRPRQRRFRPDRPPDGRAAGTARPAVRSRTGSEPRAKRPRGAVGQRCALDHLGDSPGNHQHPLPPSTVPTCPPTRARRRPRAPARAGPDARPDERHASSGHTSWLLTLLPARHRPQIARSQYEAATTNNGCRRLNPWSTGYQAFASTAATRTSPVGPPISGSACAWVPVNHEVVTPFLPHVRS